MAGESTSTPIRIKLQSRSTHPYFHTVVTTCCNNKGIYSYYFNLPPTNAPAKFLFFPLSETKLYSTQLWTVSGWQVGFLRRGRPKGKSRPGLYASCRIKRDLVFKECIPLRHYARMIMDQKENLRGLILINALFWYNLKGSFKPNRAYTI